MWWDGWLVWNHEKHSKAEAHYRCLVSQGCTARMWLAYAGNSWKVAVQEL